MGLKQLKLMIVICYFIYLFLAVWTYLLISYSGAGEKFLTLPLTHGVLARPCPMDSLWRHRCWLNDGVQTSPRRSVARERAQVPLCTVGILVAQVPAVSMVWSHIIRRFDRGATSFFKIKVDSFKCKHCSPGQKPC